MSTFPILQEMLSLLEDGPTITGMYAPTNGLLKPEFPIMQSRQEENVPPTDPIDKPKIFGKKIRRKMTTQGRAKLFVKLRSRGLT